MNERGTTASFADRHPEGFGFERALWRYLAARLPVMRAHEGAAFAPFMRAYQHKLWLPDFFVLPSDNPYPLFVEAKFKTEAPTMSIWGCRTTGVDRRDLLNYQQVERTTGYPVWILFGHEGENEVRVAPVNSESWRQGIGMWGSHMMWRDYDKLQVYSTYQEIAKAPEPTKRIDAEAFWTEAGRRPVPLALPGLE